jgi:DNA-binding beta-propeller fold protein YncE
VLAGLLMLAGAGVATAKSLYVIAEVEYGEQRIRVHAYDVAPDGKLTFQAQGYVPLQGAKALGLALDSDSRHLFLTCLTSNVITLLDAVTLQGEGATRVEGARSLTGVVYDHGNGLLYCVDGITPNLYVYRWNPARHELTPAPGSPFRLEAAQPSGIALDEVTDELYVCNSSESIGVYSTLDWRLTKTVSVSRAAAHVAVDPIRGCLLRRRRPGNMYRAAPIRPPARKRKPGSATGSASWA